MQARPRTPEEIEHLADCPDVVAEAEKKGIKNVVHFTTMRGAVGILATDALKSRARLSEDDYLEHVYRPNAQLRKDQVWLDYVNLSIERINDWMFETSMRWHAADNNPWVVLSFNPQILAHPGVVFTTTNNIYPACRRAEGLAGFSAMFADSVCGRYGTMYDRSNTRLEWPTDRQAEVLYPGELSCAHLQRIDVQLEESIDSICGILGGLAFDRSVPVCHAPEVFK